MVCVRSLEGYSSSRGRLDLATFPSCGGRLAGVGAATGCPGVPGPAGPVAFADCLPSGLVVRLDLFDGPVSVGDLHEAFGPGWGSIPSHL